MREITVIEQEVMYSDAKFIVTGIVQIVPKNALSAEEQEFPTFGEQISDGLSTIDIQNCLTGEINSIPVSNILQSAPNADNGEFYIRTKSIAQAAHDTRKLLSKEEFQAERTKRGLK